MHHWEKKLILLRCFRKADTAAQQGRPATPHETLGKRWETAGQNVRGFSSLPGWEQDKSCSAGHPFLCFWEIQSGCGTELPEQGGQEASAPRLPWGPLSSALQARWPQHDARFSALQGALAEFSVLTASLLLPQLCCPPRAQPLEITHHLPLPSSPSLAMASFPTQVTS